MTLSYKESSRTICFPGICRSEFRRAWCMNDRRMRPSRRGQETRLIFSNSDWDKHIPKTYRTFEKTGHASNQKWVIREEPGFSPKWGHLYSSDEFKSNQRKKHNYVLYAGNVFQWAPTNACNGTLSCLGRPKKLAQVAVCHILWQLIGKYLHRSRDSLSLFLESM